MVTADRQQMDENTEAPTVKEIDEALGGIEEKYGPSMAQFLKANSGADLVWGGTEVKLYWSSDRECWCVYDPGHWTHRLQTMFEYEHFHLAFQHWMEGSGA